MATILTTVDDVIAELGGVHAVAQLTQRGATAVHNWRKRACFPAVLYDGMIGQLRRRRMNAPPELWGQEPIALAA